MNFKCKKPKIMTKKFWSKNEKKAAFFHFLTKKNIFGFSEYFDCNLSRDTKKH